MMMVHGSVEVDRTKLEQQSRSEERDTLWLRDVRPSPTRQCLAWTVLFAISAAGYGRGYAYTALYGGGYANAYGGGYSGIPGERYTRR